MREFQKLESRKCKLRENFSVYCTVANLPEIDFDHILNIQTGNIVSRINDLVEQVTDSGRREMTATLYDVIKHIMMTKHQVDLTISSDIFQIF